MSQGFFEQLLIILCCAVIATTIFRRIQLPPLLAYLAVGALVGPFSLGIIENTDSIHLLSELGVVFLLFMLGLEFSVSRMFSMRKAVFGLGSLQVISTSVVLVLLALAVGLSLTTALILAGALSLSSTAIVSKELIQRNELDTLHGKLSIGTLIFQDLAAVFFLILIPSLNTQSQEIDSATIALMFLEGATLLIILLVVGRIIMPMLFHESAHSGSSDVFVLTTLAAALLAAWLTHEAGLSMALGGFLAGMMLGESQYRYQLEADIRPFRDLLLGLFFVSVGMQLDLQTLLQNWYWVIFFALGLIVLKTLLITIFGTLLHRDLPSALKAGLSLSQGGEFGFALLALAMGNSLIDPSVNAIAIATIIISMILTPILMNHTHRLSGWLTTNSPSPQDEPETPDLLEAATHELRDHVIICGFGRVGQIIARFLDPLNIPYIVIDNDPVRVAEASTAGEHICYGDAGRTDIITAVGAGRARMMIFTYPDSDKTLAALKHIRPCFKDLPILVRTRDDSMLEAFQNSGATEVIPEALEGSLMLVSHVLSLLDISHTEIEKQINQVRSERYHLLHGYYHGQHSRKVDDEGHMKEILHPVQISETSYACGKSLRKLHLQRVGVSINMIKRLDHAEHSPAAETKIQNGDIVILQGPTKQIEIAEEILLSGP